MYNATDDMFVIYQMKRRAQDFDEKAVEWVENLIGTVQVTNCTNNVHNYATLLCSRTRGGRE